MPSETGVLAKTLTYSFPVIFRSYRSESFSLSLSQTSVRQETEISNSYLVNRKPATGSFAFYDTFPEPAPNPQHAAYSFCVHVSAIPEVKAVTYQTENDIIIVWTFISKRDKRVRRLIYEREMELMESYPNMIFDFNVVNIANYSESFIPQDLQGYLSYYKNF